MLLSMSRRITLTGLSLALLSPVTALAHPGSEAHSFIAGALHPLGGLDHLLAMLAVGLLAGSAAGNMRWWLPATFVSAIAVGGALGAIGEGGALIEIGIAFSLVVFGTALVLKRPLRAPMLVMLTAVFALFHGHAHGAEMGAHLSALPYAAGFMLATALLHGFGVVLATRPILPVSQAMLFKWSGSAIAAVGVVSLGALLVLPA